MEVLKRGRTGCAFEWLRAVIQAQVTQTQANQATAMARQPCASRTSSPTDGAACCWLPEAQPAVRAALGARGLERRHARRALRFLGVKVGHTRAALQALADHLLVEVQVVGLLGHRQVFARDREPALGASTAAGQRAGEALDAFPLQQLLDLAQVLGGTLKEDGLFGHGVSVPIRARGASWSLSRARPGFAPRVRSAPCHGQTARRSTLRSSVDRSAQSRSAAARS